MDPSNPSHVAKIFMDYMNDNMDEDLVRIYFESNTQEEFVSSKALVYTDEQFRRRYRMRKHVFLHIVETLDQHDEYFQLRVDAPGRSNISPIKKCTDVICMLADETSADSVDDYLRNGETTTRKCADKFTRGKPSQCCKEKREYCLPNIKKAQGRISTQTHHWIRTIKFESDKKTRQETRA
ncbi:hypothetical protein MTR_7g027205 [Medicago truncatula]|uniref:Uncharacterized protein n=1 Tax=Medicago truncatula TaxID=3880 RepID=A0A072TWZ1_MEDTR|nr:hypothetical protein MTR_7g027205 [Medicago truncatula]